jgi:hypothetical protein
MSFIKIIPFCASFARKARRVKMLLLLLGALAASNAWAVERAYYSGNGSVGFPIPPNVALSTSVDASNLTLAATITTSASSAVKLRLKLNGIAPAGYRAGMLVSNSAGSAVASGLTVVTLRTFVNDVQQEERVVDVSLVQSALLNNNNQPGQFEFNSTKDFNQVEIEFGAAGYGLLGVSLGGRQIQIRYAYGVGQELASCRSSRLLRLISITPTGRTNRVASASTAMWATPSRPLIRT